MKTLIIVRHGNTFRVGEESRRIGCFSDFPLVESSRSITAARIIKSHRLVPDNVIAAPLLRTMLTAELIVRELGLDCPIHLDSNFLEIGYGLDEGRTESEVIRRLGTFYLGESAAPDLIMQRGKLEIERWDNDGIVPVGWKVDVAKIIAVWRNLADKIEEGTTSLVVSSNGIIRFAPHILEQNDLEIFKKNHNLKVTTAAVSILVQKNNKWNITDWNIKPSEENIIGYL
ncbi:MAG: histidine phosphatase family protein [Planctomycetaceae bacterium]|jgi:probable phosphoglycerate mutase|nr:histidine phosphatase family protein [Planctomycetaceae bacterium]